MFLGNALEISGEIIGGKGIFLPSQFGDKIGEGAVRIFDRAFEHQMFKKMRNAGFARRIIRRAIAIPDHMGDNGGAQVRNDHNLKAVVEVEM